MDTFNESLGLKIPGHVAVILDGNGRWAKKDISQEQWDMCREAKLLKICFMS